MPVWFSIMAIMLPTTIVDVGAEDDIHAVYISVVEIGRASNENATVKIKVFTNDISDALFNYGQKRFKFSDAQECAVDAQTITGYFNDHLKIFINGDPVSISFESCELNGESVWFIFKAETPTGWHEFKVEGDHLMELFPTQVNIFSISDGVNKKMFKLTSTQKELTFNFPN